MERRTWLGFIDAIRQAREELGCPKETWYRGVTSHRYRLYPSLLRPRADCRVHHERSIFEEADGVAFGNESPTNSWERLVLLQHHGTPTRLLDWTEVFAVALYFALGGLNPVDGSGTSAVWILNPFKLAQRTRGSNDKTIGMFHRQPKFDYYENFICDDKPVWPYSASMPFRPPKLTPRVRSQRAFFTVHGTDCRPIDAVSRECVRQVRLFPEAIEPARQFLELAGIDHLAVFPDQDGFNKRLKERYT